MRQILAFALLLAAPAGALAEEPLPMTPDKAALACEARSQHEMKEKGAKAVAVTHYDTTEIGDFKYRVEGVYAVTLDNAKKSVEVVCDVSTAGVDVFTMTVGQANESARASDGG